MMSVLDFSLLGFEARVPGGMFPVETLGLTVASCNS